jgi:hypothetical protein
MQDLDSFIAPIPSFEDDILIPAIPISARPPSGEAIDDPSTRSSAGASKTRANNWKATANLTPQQKAKKATGRSSSGIKINEPVPKTSALTRPSGLQKGIPIDQSIRYSYLEYTLFIADYMVNREPLCRVPWDIDPAPSAKSVSVGSESPKVDEPPSPLTEKTILEPSKPPSLTGTQGPVGASGTLTSPTRMASG